MTEEEKKEGMQPEERQFRFIAEERLQEIVSILLPWGYSRTEPRCYTGVSPYIDEYTNIITIIANDPNWGDDAVLSICMERVDENCSEDDMLGYYKGIMKVIAPELYSNNEEFKGNDNVLDFEWAIDAVQNNQFPVKVTLRDFDPSKPKEQ